MHLSTALFLGLLGGLHCAGMCGPLMLALPPGAASPVKFVAGRLTYQAGRVLTYAVLGLLAGWVGRGLALAGVQQGVSILLGVLLLLGLVASPRLLELPWITRGVGRLRQAMGGFLRRRTFASLFLLGNLNGLLPCGLVYAACAGAASTGTALEGAGYMVLFGVGTVPVMLGIGLTGHLLPMAVRLRLRHLVPVSVGLVACLLILRGLSLGIPYLSPDLADGLACHTP